MPHTEQLSPIPSEQQHNFFEQDFATNVASDQQRLDESSLEKDAALSSDVSLSKDASIAKQEAPAQKKPIKKIAVCFSFHSP